MKLKWVLAVVMVMAGLLTGSFGCKSGSTTTAVPGTSAATAKPAVTTTTKAPVASSAPSSGKTLADILGRASGIASVKYDMEITPPGAQPMTQKIWVKKNKMRTEMSQQGQDTVLLVDMDAKTMYTYMPAQNTAIKMAFDPANKSAVGESQSVQGYNPKTVGTETIDGKLCTIVEYTVQGTLTKSWIWQDRGLPIRVEATSAQGKTIMEYKNLEFSDIPDSMFELPAGVQMMTMPGS
jgi:hypothetical protein